MFVMGIAGGTGSGKTTFTTTLINKFRDDITVIHHDNYYNILDHLTFEERCLVNYDHPDSFDTKMMIEDIKKLKNGETIEEPVYDYVVHNRSKDKTITLKPSKILIVEGILILENEELRRQLREANDKLVEYENIKRENEQFREFLQLKENNPDYDFETATVIGRDSTSRFGSFTIDKGSVDGIEVADPVITSDGLVGIVWEVGLTYSHVRTVIDISVDVGVYSISTRDSGIVSGDITLSSEGLCKLHYLPKNSGISAGELIVTSGIGGVFPKNLVVGTVRSIELDSNGLSLSAAIEPAADIAGVTDVLVIKSFDGQSGGVSAESGEAGK